MINNCKFIYSSPIIEREFINTPRKICIAAHTTPYFDGIIIYRALKYFGEDNPQAYVRGYSPYFPKWCIPISSTGGFIKTKYYHYKIQKNFVEFYFLLEELSIGKQVFMYWQKNWMLKLL